MNTKIEVQDSAPRAVQPIGPQDFANAMRNREIHLHYQPQVDAAEGRLAGCEALARWTSPQFGIVGPDTFIPVMEASGQADTFWELLLLLVARDQAGLTNQMHRPVHLALNLSARQLQNPDLAPRFVGWADRQGIDPSHIHIELTESALLDPTTILFSNLDVLRDAGVAIWLDDFGTGYSSLKHLRDLPITGLKIDRSFVMELEENLDDFRIVSAIVAMASSLGLQIVAEGVETREQAQILTQLGCTLLQGYLIGKPAPMEVLAANWGMKCAA